MARILKKKGIAPDIYLMVVESPMIAKKAIAGQFIIVRVHEKGERIPLTIADFDRESGTIEMVFQVVGKTTAMLSHLNEGDDIPDILGPLGKPIEIKNYGSVILVGGGVGIAPIYPKAKALKEAGNKITTIIGARSREHLIFERRLANYSDELYIATDDGSAGRKGFVSDILTDLLEKDTYDLVIAIGPVIMMKVVSDITKKYNVETHVSLNSLMVDGSGMCGACRIIYDGKIRFTCVDGPVFDGHKVDFDNLMKRLKSYTKEEKQSYELYKREIEYAEK